MHSVCSLLGSNGSQGRDDELSVCLQFDVMLESLGGFTAAEFAVAESGQTLFAAPDNPAMWRRAGRVPNSALNVWLEVFTASALLACAEIHFVINVGGLLSNKHFFFFK